MNQKIPFFVAGIALLPQMLTCSQTHLLIYGACALCVGAAAVIKRHLNFRFLALSWGFVLPLMPFLGVEIVETASLLVVLVLVALSPQVRWFGWGAPILFYLGGSALYETAASVIGQHSYASLVRLDELSRVHDALRGFFAVQAPSWRYLSHVVLLVGCVDIFSSLPALGAHWRKGFLVGATLSALYAVTQWCGILPWTLPNQTPFWTAIGRVSGLMTDPNALGVVMALALWILLYRDAPTRVVTRGILTPALLFMAAGIVSGSRTFWIGLSVLVIGMAYRRAPRLLWKLVVACMVLLAAVSVVDVYTPLITMVQASDSLPQGIKRIISAMSLARIEDTIASRRIFFTLARSIIERDPLFGVGPNAFAAYVPLAGASIPSLRGWIDNSNNFYLGIIGELGILGFCAFLMTVTARRLRVSDVPLAKAAIVAVGVMLVTGPHIDFVEVLVPVAFLFGMGTTPRRGQSYVTAYISILFAISGAISASHHERGVYGWRADGSGIRRWLSPASIIQVRCADEQAKNEGKIVFKPAYVPTREPLRLAIQSKEYARELDLSDPSEQSILLPCGRYSVSVTPAWSPARAWPQDSADRRLLGVEQVERLN